MEKFTRFVPITAFMLFAAKALVVPGANTFQDGVIIAILALLAGYIESRIENKELKELKSQINELKSYQADAEKRDVELRNHINGIKMGQNIRSNTMSR